MPRKELHILSALPSHLIMLDTHPRIPLAHLLRPLCVPVKQLFLTRQPSPPHLTRLTISGYANDDWVIGCIVTHNSLYSITTVSVGERGAITGHAPLLIYPHQSSRKKKARHRSSGDLAQSDAHGPGFSQATFNQRLTIINIIIDTPCLLKPVSKAASRRLGCPTESVR